jgi:hypothetical protein
VKRRRREVRRTAPRMRRVWEALMERRRRARIRKNR